MIGDKKLTKAADNLYTEPYKDGKDFNWYRELQMLSMDVYDIALLNVSSVDDPKFPLGSDKYEEKRGEYLRGVGVFDNRSIHLINEDGEIGPGVDQMEFSIRSLEPDDGKDMPHGSMWWQDAEAVRWEGRRDQHLFMAIYVSPKLFHGIVADIEKRSYESIQLGVYVEVFQSEVERSLAEPWMSQDYCIEEGGMATTYFQGLSVKNRSPSPHGKSLPKDDEDDWNDEEEWGEPQQEVQEPIAEIRDLFTVYATTIAKHANGIKVALYWILFVLILANIPW